MYLKHFGLERMPFEIGPDPKFLWLGSKHKEAYSVLRYGILESKGFVVIAGDPGTGKSTLLNATIAAFDSSVRFAKINDPALNATEFFNFAADALDMGRNFQSKGEFLIQLKHFIREAAPQKLILVIDEAQRITPGMLEQIRIFTDSDEPGRKIFSCVLAGQLEFLETVKQNRALSQRIFFSHTIQPLALLETEEYIAHRLKVAGCSKPLFTTAAIKEIYKLSKGVPRLINILCDQGLLAGYASIQTRIGPELIRECVDSTQIPLQTVADTPPKPPAPVPEAAPASEAQEISRTASQETTSTGRPSRRRAYISLTAALLVLVLVGFFYFLPRHTPQADGSDQSDKAERVQLQAQIAELKRQRDSSETQSKNLQTNLATLQNELKQLQGANERAAEREKESLQKDASIAELRQKIELSGAGQPAVAKQIESLQRENSRLQALLTETNSQRSAAETKLADQTAKLQSASGRAAEREKELLQKDASIAEMRQKLELSAAGQSTLSKQIESLQKENGRLQAQLTEANSQKNAAETKLADQQKMLTGLSADAKTVKTATERVAQLEGALAERDKKQAQLESAFGDLEKAIAKEKGANAQMKAELASQQAAAIDLQKKFETLKSLQQKSETDARNAQSENARLQSQLQELKGRAAPAAAPAAAKPQTVVQPAPVSQGLTEGPDPAGAIDYVIKRKSK